MSDIKPLACEVQIGFEDHVSTYSIDLDTVYEIIDQNHDLDSARLLVVIKGTYVEHQTEGDVFVDASAKFGVDAHQEFIRDLDGWLDRNEDAVIEANRRREDYA